MNYRETRLSTPVRLHLHQRSWVPDNRPAATVVLLHGLGEHAGRYAPLAESLVAQGYAVTAVDLRGHGLSDGSRIYIDSFRQYLDDMAWFLQHVRAEQPQGSLFLFGHSMGGLIAAWLATQNIPGVCGTAVSSPALMIHSRVFPVLRWLALPAGLLLPRLRVVTANYAMASRDPHVVAAMENDPLVYHGRIPNRTSSELLRAGAELQQHMGAIRQPLLILHGTCDKISDPQGAHQLYQRAGTTDKSLKLYDGLYHNLLDEPEKDQVVADLIAWLNARRG